MKIPDYLSHPQPTWEFEKPLDSEEPTAVQGLQIYQLQIIKLTKRYQPKLNMMIKRYSQKQKSNHSLQSTVQTEIKTNIKTELGLKIEIKTIIKPKVGLE